jgi:hypothetical protein
MREAPSMANRLQWYGFNQYGVMKKILIGLFTVALFSCNNDGDREGGTINDGIKTVDSNGALNDNGGPLTDTAAGIENRTRTDIQQRDTFTSPAQ